MAVIPPTISGSVTLARTGSPATGPNTLTFTHTVTAQTEVLLIYAQHDSFATEAPIVSWMGNGITCYQQITGRTGYLYELLNPTVGTGDIVVFHDHVFTATIAAGAVNVRNFGGVRFAEFNAKAYFDSDPTELTTSIYCRSTDLVLSWFGWVGAAGQTVTADAGQTVLASQTGAADAGVSIALGQVIAPVNTGFPAVEANFTTVEWNTTSAPFLSNITQYLLAIEGIDNAPPAGAPVYIGRVTAVMTPPVQSAVAVADNPHVWRHEVPTTHTTLAVLATYFDQQTTAVYWRPDSTDVEVEVPLLFSISRGAVAVLEGATTGLGYLRVVNVNRRPYGATAVSLSGTDLVAGFDASAPGPGFNAGGIEIASEVDGIVIDRISQNVDSFKSWTPEWTGIYDQSIYGTLNDTPAAANSQAGASSYTIATGVLTKLSWLADPADNDGQVAISFIGVEPPVPTFTTRTVIPVRERIAPHLSREQLWHFYDWIQLDFESGVGLGNVVSTTQGFDPVCELCWSDDGGHAWSNWHTLGLGKRGKYAYRTILRRLGRSRDRVFWVRVSDPVKSNLLAAYLSVTPGTS